MVLPKTRMGLIRLAKGFTQRELAKRIQMPYLVLSRIENGDRRIKPTEALAIAGVLEIDVAELFSMDLVRFEVTPAEELLG